MKKLVELFQELALYGHIRVEVTHDAVIFDDVGPHGATTLIVYEDGSYRYMSRDPFGYTEGRGLLVQEQEG